MIPEDKFGRAIYPNVFEKLKHNEKILLSLGYLENKNKPNLFYKKTPQGWLNADMRGTEDVPIWEDTWPMFFWFFDSNVPKWERRRVIKQELIKLMNVGCPCRLYFYALHSSEEFEEVGGSVDAESNIYDWDDGFCRFCGKDFKNEGSFCSDECDKKYEDALKIPCQVCNEKIPRFEEVRHHVSYFPEKTILVHASCHNKIHKTDLFPALRPTNEDVDRFYSHKNIQGIKRSRRGLLRYMIK